jgi:hypothetical protein
MASNTATTIAFTVEGQRAWALARRGLLSAGRGAFAPGPGGRLTHDVPGSGGYVDRTCPMTAAF